MVKYSFFLCHSIRRNDLLLTNPIHYLASGLQHQPDDLSRSASREWSDEMRDLGRDNPQSESKSSTDLAESENPPHDNYQQFLNKILPTFDNSTATNITTTAGKTVFLPCNVRHLADKTVNRGLF